MQLPHQMERSVVIHAPRDTVFRYFTDTPRWAAWWGAGSTIDPRRGGRVYIRYPNGVEVAGEVIDVAPPERIVFSYGFVSGDPIPTGSSRVTIELEPRGLGTLLLLRHDFAQATVRDQHVQGWRYQLAVFSNVVTDELHASLSSTIDRWFDLWAEPDESNRERGLREMTEPDVQFRDRFSATDGIDDLLPHIAAAQRFMPGIRLRRDGAPRHCQGSALADWIAIGENGAERARGTNVFELSPRGRIRSVIGFWTHP